jgi:hypothetical protein
MKHTLLYRHGDRNNHPIKDFEDEKSSGVSYFEKFVWDLQKHGTSDRDMPGLIFGIAAN